MHRAAPSNVRFQNLDEINNPNLGPTELYGRTNDRVYAVSVHPDRQVNAAIQQQWKDAYPGITGKLLTGAMLAFGRDPEQGSSALTIAQTTQS
ncbi:hypothetical protein B0T26DRAFT_868908 [Lasiosphaeria miniovina]|uniref:Uncharacterized protein n=1 Tax=Lasiosphaeria miniovina TaxID=1954250 RepID=A0AA40E5A4_9PEZI|nr:uncharacterized protein B0T26DRAFT_868908 [Lasiosphaeria miniovina]KAK0727670.1 hypothetical protein B0T26DRAFT_868908 [Lasiosphaeria miniovina]